MRLDKLAVTAQEAFQAAMGIASDADTSSVEPIHLLKALLDAGAVEKVEEDKKNDGK